jgi:hypothetical protein
MLSRSSARSTTWLIFYAALVTLDTTLMVEAILLTVRLLPSAKRTSMLSTLSRVDILIHFSIRSLAKPFGRGGLEVGVLRQYAKLSAPHAEKEESRRGRIDSSKAIL